MDANILVELGAADDLKRAYSQLAYLGARYRVWEAPEELNDRQKQKDDLNLILSSCMSFGAIDLGGINLGYINFEDWWKQAEFVSFTPEEAAVIQQTKRWIGDFSVLVFTLFVAVLTVLTQFYFGKTFGTWQDYLTVVFIGAGSQVVLPVLVDTITKLRKPLKV
jgi:hypothetical protein